MAPRLVLLSRANVECGVGVRGDRPLPGAAAHRRGRHGRGLRGARPRARPAGRAQDDARPRPDALFRFKREFRALAISATRTWPRWTSCIDERGWFFTMELVDGVDFLALGARRRLASRRRVRADDVERRRRTSADRGTRRRRWRRRAGRGPTVEAAHPVAARSTRRGCAPALRQLGRGLDALHARRQDPPRHQAVERAGHARRARGAARLRAGRRTTSAASARDRARRVVGTPAYMAPEQARDRARSARRADWYAVGVMLYEALTGRLPFVGAAARVLLDKQRPTPPPPRAAGARRRRATSTRCACELLRRDPGRAAERRRGAAPARRDSGDRAAPLDGQLARATAPRSSAATPSWPRSRTRFDAARARRAALRVRARRVGASARARWCSASSSGSRQRHPKRWSSPGRCYEREAVPYKAIDSLIDALSRHCCSSPPRRGARAAAAPTRRSCRRLFPVLGRVPAVADAPARCRTSPTRRSCARRAFGALREVLAAARRPPSAGPRSSTICSGPTPTPSRCSPISCARPIRRRSCCCSPLASTAARRCSSLARGAGCQHRVVEVGPLARRGGPRAGDRAARRRSGLARAGRTNRARSGGQPVLSPRARALHAGAQRPGDASARRSTRCCSSGSPASANEARALVEVVAVAGEPMALRAAGLAASLSGEALARQLAALRARSGSCAPPAAAPTIRSSPITIGCARRWSEASTRRAARDCTARSPPRSPARRRAARLARHWHGAGDKQRAAEYARRAAEEAIGTLDFDRAAGLYRMALDSRRARSSRSAAPCAPGSAPRSATPAAPSRPRASSRSPPPTATRPTALELRRRAADALLRGGYIDEGSRRPARSSARSASGSPRRPAARSPRSSPGAPGCGCAGSDFRRVRCRPISQPELTRVDVCEGVAMGLVMVDTFRSMDFSARFLHEALRLGEPWRIARAFALEADFLAVQAKTARAEALLARLEELTPRSTRRKRRRSS